MNADKYLLPLDICLYFFAIAIHSVGIYVLHSIKGGDIVQKCFLIHISLSEIVLTTLNIISASVSLTTLHPHERKHFQVYLRIATESCTLPLYAGLSLLTMERFLQVYLHLRYNDSWFDRNKKNICVVTWCIAIASAVVIGVVHHSANHQCHHRVLNVLTSLVLTTVPVSYTHLTLPTKA